MDRIDHIPRTSNFANTESSDTLERKCVQFTDEDKSRVFNWIRGSNKYAYFEGKPNQWEPVLRIVNPDGDICLVRLGDWIIDCGDRYEVVGEKY